MPSHSGTVLITGASSGIGRATAMRFARDGWRVGLIARGSAGLQAAAAEIRGAGGTAAVATADVVDLAALTAAAAAIAETLGAPDIWINCAGNGVYGSFADVPEADFNRVTAVTYTGTVNGTRTALALMAPAGRGSIVNVCSAAAFHGLPLMTSYAGAKAAVRGFGQAIQAELRMQGSAIRLCTVFPPAVNTPFFSHAVSYMGFPARPAPPVYQPEAIAAGIMLAARLKTPELALTGTALLFALACRLCPAAIAWAMTRLGFEGQLTRDPAAAECLSPALFKPGAAPFTVRGPFDSKARRWSLHIGLLQWTSRLRGAGSVASDEAPRLPFEAAPAAGPQEPAAEISSRPII